VTLGRKRTPKPYLATTKTKHMIVKQGPSFTGPLSKVGGVASVISVSIFVLVLTGTEGLVHHLGGLVMGALLVASLHLFLRMQGVEVDIKKQQVRHYYNWMGLRHGEFQSLKEYDILALRIDRYTGTEGSSVMQTLRVTHHQAYEVVLKSDHHDESIMLYESLSYPETKKYLSRCSAQLLMKPNDEFAAELVNAKKNRRR
jgi:hypothetical protein